MRKTVGVLALAALLSGCQLQWPDTVGSVRMAEDGTIFVRLAADRDGEIIGNPGGAL